MGNEMGNNNTSGLQEEDKTEIEDQGKSIEEAAPGIAEKVENHAVSVAEDKDYNDKGGGLAANNPKRTEDDRNLDGSESPKADLKSNEGCDADTEVRPPSFSNEMEVHEKPTETEIHPSAESPKADLKSNEGCDADTEVRPPSFSNEMEVHEKPTDSYLEEDAPERSHYLLEKQVSFKKEEKDVSNSTALTISTSDDQETQDSEEPKSDGLGFTKVDADQPPLDSTYSPGGVEDVQESSVSGKENDQQSYSLDGIVVSEMKSKREEFLVKDMISQEDKIPDTSDFESGEDGLGTDTSDFASDVGKQYDGDATSEMNCSGKGFQSEDKFMVSDETELKRRESKNQATQQDSISAQCIDDYVEELETEEANESPIDPLMEPNSLIDGNAYSISVSHDPPSTENCQGEATVGELCHSKEYFDDNQKNEAGQESCEESKGKTKIVPEFGNNGQESNGCKHEEDEPAEKEMVGEMMVGLEDSCSTEKGAEVKENGEQVIFQSLHVQEHESDIPASLSQTLDQQMVATESKNAQESTQPENFVDFFLTTVSTFQATEMTVEPLISPEASDYVIPAPDQMVTETSLTAPTSQDTEQREQFETTSVIALISPVEFEVNKYPPEASDYEIASPEKPEQVETTSVIAMSGNEGSMRRLSTESIPQDLNIHPKTRKCPSFDFGLRIKPRSEESDQTPLLYQDKTTIRSSFSHQVDVINQNSLLGDQYSEAALQSEAIPVEEKVISLERSDSEKFRTPFLISSMKEEAKDNNHSTTAKASYSTTAKASYSTTAKASSSLPKSKEKHKRRASLFRNCICCATVIN